MLFIQICKLFIRVQKEMMCIILMFVAEALFDFSEAVLKNSQKNEEDEPLYKKSQAQDEEPAEQLDKGKRKRSEDHDRQLRKQGGEVEQKEEAEQKQQKQQNTVQYLNFEKGEKILVQHAYQNGWWYGHAIKRPKENGFFPSNYVKAGAKPPPPPPPKKQQESEEQEAEYDSEQRVQWINKKLTEEQEAQQQKVLTSDYYQGITGFKYVKINENNKNILKGNYVQFDVNTGLARVPVKDQAPTAKAVRQMGYYFDYHQWNQQKNKNPQAWKGKPDPSKKNKKKKLYLKGMGKDA